MAALGRLNLPKALREIRIHLCQTSKSSQGVRDFLEKYYVGLKKENPKFPFLVRECSGIQPKIYARYGFGNETSVSLADKNCDEVLQEVDKLVKAEK
ncbi:NADH dehydrogenase [ubiquinone] 1 alpha subcomplex subunit 2-like [Dendronephthya gigantea]|uniref:NADH dehydrogenase [ubiquinone] 1 alpha subcomplex subunit 2-like n=1 Tax=Dendronephthya gigantea TaxID=151771 RepID=UPI00106CD92E|nr:NADH dehydrogenase [ubiquinone] 1 alpha subcomplex subunit 2-like [Dendronephthya gigantea]